MAARLPLIFGLGFWFAAASTVAAQTPPTLAWTAQSTFSVEQERLGYSVSHLPDVTGDGVPDVVAGVLMAPGFDGTLWAGRVDIYDGVSGTPIRSVLSPTPDLFGFFGRMVMGLDDIDGDGWGDFVAGAFPEEPPPNPANCGAIHFFSGRTGTLLRTQVSPQAEIDGLFGAWMAVAGDLDNDGRSDLLVTAPGESSGAPRSGNIYAFNAVTGDLITSFTSPNPQAAGFFGYTIAPVPDFNNDGVLDFITGCYPETSGSLPLESGTAYVYDGRTGALVYSLTSPSPTLQGHFGWIVGGVPDLDGDGRGDFIVGARREIKPGSGINSGRAHAYSGATGSYLYSVDTPDPTQDGHFGRHMTGLPDVTGDGRGDFAVGAYQEPGHARIYRSGTVYVFNGATGAIHIQIKGGTTTYLGGFGNQLAGPYKYQPGHPVPLIVGEYQAGPNITGAVHRFLLSPTTSAAKEWSLYE
jgi:hypothetical protein